MKKLFLAIFLLFVLASCQMEYLAGFSASNPPLTPGREINVNVIDSAVNLLQREYYKAVVPNKLLNGVLDGFSLYLKEKVKQQQPLAKLSLAESYDVNYQKVLAKYQQLIIKYPKLNRSDLVYAGLNGMMASLDDPYTVALTPKDNQLFNEHMEGGNFTGIGIVMELDKKTKQLTIFEPVEETPAQQAGLKAGDRIIKINGDSTKGMSLDAAAQKIRGAKGSIVVLTIKRKDLPLKDYPIARDFIHVSSAAAKLYKGLVGYIKLRVFGSETREEFAQCLGKLQKAGMKALVVDLRNNGGGYVQAAIDVCGFFLPTVSLVTSVVAPKSGDEKYFASPAYKMDVPVVILINRYSASASEIVAGAFHDYQSATLLGEKSFGKGSVQSIFKLPDGGAIKYTIAHYLTPKGIDIHEKGILPDITLEMDPDKIGGSTDWQLMKAIKLLKGKINPQAMLFDLAIAA